MAALEAEVRKIETDGLLWGASKLVAVGYGIKKLQICCVVEDDKVGTDFLEEEITAIEDFVSFYQLDQNKPVVGPICRCRRFQQDLKQLLTCRDISCDISARLFITRNTPPVLLLAL